MTNLRKQFIVALSLSSAFLLFEGNARGNDGTINAGASGSSSLVIRDRSVLHHRGYVDASGNRVGHFRCGLTQRLYFGLPPEFNLALHWATLPHTSPAPNVVVVQRRKGRALGGGPGGHVSRIVSVINSCRAIVTDEKGTYERDICKNLVAYVRPE